jgi:hypothetical protein
MRRSPYSAARSYPAPIMDFCSITLAFAEGLGMTWKIEPPTEGKPTAVLSFAAPASSCHKDLQ